MLTTLRRNMMTYPGACGCDKFVLLAMEYSVYMQTCLWSVSKHKYFIKSMATLWLHPSKMYELRVFDCHQSCKRINVCGSARKRRLILKRFDLHVQIQSPFKWSYAVLHSLCVLRKQDRRVLSLCVCLMYIPCQCHAYEKREILMIRKYEQFVYNQHNKTRYA